MKKLLVLFSVFFFLTACSETDQVQSNSNNEQEKQQEQEKPKENAKKTEDDQKESAEKTEESAESETETEADVESTIDTSMYTAENIEVTDAISITQHVTLMIDVNESVKQGMAFQNVLNQSYDFLTQDGIEGAKTVAIIIRQNEKKIAQLKTEIGKFVEDDSTPMAQLVLDASVVEVVTPEIEEYANVMGLELHK